MALIFSHLANLGYAPVARDDNMQGDRGCCSEFSFLQVERQLPAASDGAGGAAGGGTSRRRKAAVKRRLSENLWEKRTEEPMAAA